jgi:hypothetical protein
MVLAPRSVAFAAGVTAVIVSTICAFLLAVAPSAATTLLGLAIHEDLSGLTPQVTWTSFGVALLFWGLGTGLVVGCAAWLYDLFVRASGAKVQT